MLSLFTMNHEEVAQRIARSHALIQTRPVDRLDCVNKTAAVKQIIMSCIAYLDQLYHQKESWEYTDEDFSRIHESVCVSAIPLLNMVEYFLEKAEEEAEKYHLAV